MLNMYIFNFLVILKQMLQDYKKVKDTCFQLHILKMLHSEAKRKMEMEIWYIDWYDWNSDKNFFDKNWCIVDRAPKSMLLY